MATLKNKYLQLASCVLLCLAVGSISGMLTADSITSWYNTLRKPSFNPPNGIFAPVWTILYCMMGVAWWYSLQTTAMAKEKIKATVLFLIQLTLNFCWSLVFFNIRNLGLAFVVLLLLWLFIFLCILHFYRQSKTAAYLMVPYLLWVSFAGVLNFAVWKLN